MIHTVAATAVITAIIATLIITVAIGCWSWTHTHQKSSLKSEKTPFDGIARITGECGDTMEITLSFDNGCVCQAGHWTDGCAHSLTCLLAATQLARGKQPDEILDIDARKIAKAAGGLPEDHDHCATLAARTLHGAIDDYMAHSTACQTAWRCCSSTPPNKQSKNQLSKHIDHTDHT